MLCGKSKLSCHCGSLVWGTTKVLGCGKWEGLLCVCGYVAGADIHSVCLLISEVMVHRILTP